MQNEPRTPRHTQSTQSTTDSPGHRPGQASHREHQGQANPANPAHSESLREALHGWRLGFSIDLETLLKSLVLAFLLILFSLLQTTLFTHFRPFGAVPDLILPLVVAVSMVFREKWGAIFGLTAAFVIESLGGSTFTILPLLYMPAGYVVGLCSVYYFRDSIAVRSLYTLITTLLRSVFTLITFAATLADLNLITVFTLAIIPEFLSTLVFSPLPHLLAKLILRPFTHDRSAEK